MESELVLCAHSQEQKPTDISWRREIFQRTLKQNTLQKKTHNLIIKQNPMWDITLKMLVSEKPTTILLTIFNKCISKHVIRVVVYAK